MSFYPMKAGLQSFGQVEKYQYLSYGDAIGREDLFAMAKELQVDMDCINSRSCVAGSNLVNCHLDCD